MPMLIAILACFCQVEDKELNPAEFARIISGLHSGIRDFEFICEGKYRFIDKSDPKSEEKMRRINKDFQSDFAYRSDGATYMDRYSKLIIPDAVPTRRVCALLNGKLTTDQRSPEQRRRNRRDLVSIQNGGVGSLLVEGSGERFVYINFWTIFTGNPSRWNIRFQKWDFINGHRCSLIHVDPYPTSQLPQKTLWKIWVDLERGGHVLRHESYEGGSLAFQVHDVELTQFDTLDGKKVWFPIHGTYDSFLSGDKYKSTPVITETSYVVDGTLVINQGLRDSRFDVEWTSPKPQSSGFRSIQEEHEKKFVAKEPVKLRRDPAGVQKWQEEKLAEAEAQAKMLEASAQSRESWSWTGVAQILGVVAGIVSLCIALVLRRRG